MLHPWMRSAAWFAIGINMGLGLYFVASGQSVLLPVVSTVALVVSLVADGRVKR